MADSTVRLNIQSSFHSEGGEQVASDARNVREELEGIATAADEAGENLTSRFSAAIEEAAQATEAAGKRMLEFRGYTGDLYADIARQATQAGDRTTAAQALYRAAQADEPESLIRRANVEFTAARREAGEGAPEGAYTESTERLARNLQTRVEDAIPTIIANTASGRLGVADRSLTNAEEYLAQLRELGHNTDALQDLTDSLAKHRDTLEEAKAERDAARADPTSGAGGRGERGFLGEMADEGMNRGLAGLGPAGGMLARMARFLGTPGGLALMAGGAVVGGGLAATRWLHGMGEEGREEALGFVDLGRNLGTSDPLMYRFTSAGFATRPELADLYYTSRQAGQFGAAYGMPTGLLGQPEDFSEDVLAGMTLARYTGASTDAMAGLMRTGRQSGAFRPGEGETFATTLFRAVQDGTRLGVSTATTFEVMERHLSALVQQGITSSQDQLAMQAALMENFAGTGSAALRGTAGANALDSMIGGLTQSGDAGMEMIALRGLSAGGEMPSAEAMGMDPESSVGRQYDQLRGTSQVMAGRFLLEQARGRNPQALAAVARGFEGALGGRTDLEYLFGTQMLGLSYEQIAELRDSHGSLFGALSEPMDRLSPEDLSMVYGQNIIDNAARGIEDPQHHGEATNLQRAGVRQARLEFLDAETSRLKSLIPATMEWTDTLSKLANTIIEDLARMREASLDDSPEWWDDRREELDERIRLRQIEEEAARNAASVATLVPEELEHPGVAPSILMDALSAQESAHDYHATNYDVGGHDAALGRYQILWSNIAGEQKGWDWDLLGKDYATPEEFRQDWQGQDNLATRRLETYYEDTDASLPVGERLGRVAAAWYAGPEFLDVPTSELPTEPTINSGNEYPSVMEYVREVLERIIEDAPGAPGGGAAGHDSGTLRIEGEGTLRIIVGDGVPAGDVLQGAMEDAIGTWRDAVGSSRYNQQNRRG